MSARSKRFSDFMTELTREAREEGPQAERELEAWGRHFELAGEIARRRKALGWTQSELAKRVGLKQSEVSRLESGNVNPTWETVRVVLGALGARVAIQDAGAKRLSRAQSARSVKADDQVEEFARRDLGDDIRRSGTSRVLRRASRPGPNSR